ncbi:ribonuclease activity regulator protein RraA [compost metagenome]
MKALGATARRGWSSVTGVGREMVNFGAAQFRPGHWVYADEDCVVVSPDELDFELTQQMATSVSPDAIGGYK